MMVMIMVEERLGGPVVVMVVVVVGVMVVGSVGRVVGVHGLEVTTTELSYLNAEPAA